MARLTRADYYDEGSGDDPVFIDDDDEIFQVNENSKYLSCKISVKSIWILNYSKNPVKWVGAMKHNFRLFLKNDRNVTIFQEQGYTRTHKWTIEKALNDKTPTEILGNELTISLERKKSCYGLCKKIRRFGDAEFSTDKIMSRNGVNTVEVLKHDKSKKKKALLTIR